MTNYQSNSILRLIKSFGSVSILIDNFLIAPIISIMYFVVDPLSIINSTISKSIHRFPIMLKPLIYLPYNHDSVLFR